MTNKRISWLGWSLIAGVWATSTYLVLHYAAVLLLGREVLLAQLGERAYNILIPVGGFTLLLIAAAACAVWAVPSSLAFLGVSLGLRLTQAVTRGRRLWLSALVAAAFTCSLPFVLLDGWPWALMPLVWEDDTEFAPGYSPVGFWLVVPGMKQDDVERLAGPPLDRYTIRNTADRGWRWSRSPNDGSYRVRVVVFRAGLVAEKHSEFYID